MRVAVVAPPWLPVPPPQYGGTELVLDGLCRALVALCHEVLLCTTGDSTCDVERSWTFERACGTASMQSCTELRHVIGAYDAICRWGADVVHDHTLVGPFYAARYPALPVVTTSHGPFESDLGTIYAALASRIPTIAISRDQASAAGLATLAGVIHHGVDLESFPLGAGAGGYALFLGRMCREKGVARAIRIARSAEVPLRIAAKMREPGEIAFFAEVVEPLLGGAVEFLGEVGHDRKVELLGDALCLLNPIAWPEPFGMVMVEALACGTPVVATPAGATTEIVDDGVTGYICNTDEEFRLALGQIDRLDRVTCRQVVQERFSTLRMAREHISVFERLLRTGASEIC